MDRFMSSRSDLCLGKNDHGISDCNCSSSLVGIELTVTKPRTNKGPTFNFVSDGVSSSHHDNKQPNPQLFHGKPDPAFQASQHHLYGHRISLTRLVLDGERFLVA